MWLLRCTFVCAFHVCWCVEPTAAFLLLDRLLRRLHVDVFDRCFFAASLPVFTVFTLWCISCVWAIQCGAGRTHATWSAEWRPAQGPGAGGGGTGPWPEDHGQQATLSGFCVYCTGPHMHAYTHLCSHRRQHAFAGPYLRPARQQATGAAHQSLALLRAGQRTT